MPKNIKFDWNTANSDLYGHYYACQILRNVAGQTWRNYLSMVYPQILANQKDDGSFEILNKGGKVDAVGASFQGSTPFAIHSRTCLVTLMLELYYRHLWIPSKIYEFQKKPKKN